MITDPAKALDAQLHFKARIEARVSKRICFTGVMDVAQRWEVIRRAILLAELADVLAGKTETFAQAFRRATGQPLTNHTENAT